MLKTASHYVEQIQNGEERRVLNDSHFIFFVSDLKINTAAHYRERISNLAHALILVLF